MPNLHLFSSPGKDDIRYIIEASRPYLAGKPDAMVAHLPLASLYVERWQDPAGDSFKGLARLETINAETMPLLKMEDIIRRASLVYIPGGNTFLLAHRLHVSRLMTFLQKKIQAGLPVVAFSAGTILCGPNILTSKDMNTVATSHFEGLNGTPFNFLTHYAEDAYGRSVQDDWLADYHFFHDNPVIMLSDGAYVQMDGRKASVVRGAEWILRKDQEKEKIGAENVIPVQDTK